MHTKSTHIRLLTQTELWPHRFPTAHRGLALSLPPALCLHSQSKPLSQKEKGICFGFQSPTSFRPKQPGLSDLARYFASSFHRLCQCSPGQSAGTRTPLSRVALTVPPAPVSCSVSSSRPGSRVFGASPNINVLVYNGIRVSIFPCDCVPFSLRLCVCVRVCFCSAAQWAHCWHRWGNCSSWLLYALSSSSFAFLVCWKGPFLSFFLSPSSAFRGQYRSFLRISFLRETLLTFNSHPSPLGLKWNLSLMSNVLSHYTKWHESESNNLPVYIF